MRFLCVALWSAVALACESPPVADSAPSSADSPVGQAATDPYRDDFERICNAERASGGDELDPANRPIHVAQWLGRNVRTQTGRDFLAKLAGANGHDKAAMLNAEAKRLGIQDCPLAFTWSGGHSGPAQ